MRRDITRRGDRRRRDVRHAVPALDHSPDSAPDSAPDRAAGRPRDLGTSLTELLVTVLIMGIVITPVMNAVIGLIRASATNRGLAHVETVLTNAADQVNRAPKRCDYTLYVQTATQLQGWSTSDASVVHRHYVPGATPQDPGTWVDGACVGSQPDDLLVQLVIITVRNPDTGAQRSIQVVKSDV